MRYLLIIRDAIDAAGTEPAGCGAWTRDMRERGVLVEEAGLVLAAEGATVRVRDGGPVVTDGPFAETKEHVGGLAVIECADLAEAAADYRRALDLAAVDAERRHLARRLAEISGR
ncbi:YciI family protein [Thermomonospora cellulosilytica]|uniref:YCII-related domain-containing protein n=1 Tax=Thermomonospora cellulosilytica TaxID=1411118 RepID=A0A7W3N127_9ACTN|nr:YciI family protein [Thermomonospora cellulosilytica]MBA9005590.1 hypothetical protein [Thermomonospora cellulosilytica]